MVPHMLTTKPQQRNLDDAAVRVYVFFFYCAGDPQDLHSFPTRRSSDLCSRARSRSRASTTRRSRCWRGAGSTCRRSEEHTSELQSRRDLVCRLLLEKKKSSHTGTCC